MSDVRCRFYVRTEVMSRAEYERRLAVRADTSHRWRYTSMALTGYHGDLTLHTQHPPAVGDVIHLYELDTARAEPLRGTFKVLARQWLHSGYGSVDWPYGQAEPTSGPELMIIVTPSTGIFVDEAPLSDAERAEYE